MINYKQSYTRHRNASLNLLQFVSESSWRRFSNSSNLTSQSFFMHKGFTLLYSTLFSSLWIPPETKPFLVLFFFLPTPPLTLFFSAVALCIAQSTSNPLNCFALLPSPCCCWCFDVGEGWWLGGWALAEKVTVFTDLAGPGRRGKNGLGWTGDVAHHMMFLGVIDRSRVNRFLRVFKLPKIWAYF